MASNVEQIIRSYPVSASGGTISAGQVVQLNSQGQIEKHQLGSGGTVPPTVPPPTVGTSLAVSKFIIGGSVAGSDRIRDLRIDALGNLYIVGIYNSQLTIQGVNGPIVLPQARGVQDGFVAKLNPQGQWLWATNLRSEASVKVEACDLSINGAFLYIAGHSFISIEVQNPDGSKIGPLPNCASPDLWVAKLQVSGIADGRWRWQWVAKSCGDAGEEGLSVVADPFGGGAYIAGNATAPPRPLDAGASGTGDVSSAFVENPQVWEDTPRGRGIVMRIGAGGQWQWVRSVGLKGPDIVPQSGGSQPVPRVVTSIAVDPQTNNLLVSGAYARGLSFPNLSGAERFGISNPQKSTSTETPSGWFGSLPRDGSRWNWAVSLGGSGTTTVSRIASDSGSSYFIAGEIEGRGLIGQTAIHSTATGTDGVQRVYEARVGVVSSLTNNSNTAVLANWAFQLDLPNATVTSTVLDAVRGRVYLSATRADTEFHGYMAESDALTGAASATVVHTSRRPSSPTQGDRADAFAVRVSPPSAGSRVFLAGGFIESLQFTGTNGSVSPVVTNPSTFDESYIAEFAAFAGAGTLARGSSGRDMKTPNNPYVISMSDCSGTGGGNQHGHGHKPCASSSCGIPAPKKEEEHHVYLSQHCGRYRNPHREEGYACPDLRHYHSCEDYKQLIVIGDGDGGGVTPPIVPTPITPGAILGIAKTSGVAGGAPVLVIVQGVCQTSSASSTLTSFVPGQRYYSAGNGQITTANTGSFLGIGLNSLEVLIRPSE